MWTYVYIYTYIKLRIYIYSIYTKLRITLWISLHHHLNPVISRKIPRAAFSQRGPSGWKSELCTSFPAPAMSFGHKRTASLGALLEVPRSAAVSGEEVSENPNRVMWDKHMRITRVDHMGNDIFMLGSYGLIQGSHIYIYIAAAIVIGINGRMLLVISHGNQRLQTETSLNSMEAFIVVSFGRISHLQI